MNKYKIKHIVLFLLALSLYSMKSSAINWNDCETTNYSSSYSETECTNIVHDGNDFTYTDNTTYGVVQDNNKDTDVDNQTNLDYANINGY